MSCLFGHKWDGCKCVKCGTTRDEGHDWDLCKGVCRRCGKTQAEQHQWERIEGKKRCVRCGKEVLPTHYVAIAISNCEEASQERLAGLNDMLINEYKNDATFSALYSKEWQYIEKVLTYPTSDFNVIRAVLEWIAKEVETSAEMLVKQSDKKLFVIKTPVPIGPSLWAVAHYFDD